MMSVVHLGYKAYFILVFTISIYYWIDKTFWEGLVFLVIGSAMFIIQGMIVSLITYFVRKMRHFIGIDLYFTEPQDNLTLFDVSIIFIMLIFTILFSIQIVEWIF